MFEQMADRRNVFVSYARADGERVATTLRTRLEQTLPMFKFWQDRSEMVGGFPWWSQIAAAIDEARCVLLVMTPAAMQSDSVRNEWQYARAQGVYVCPIRDPDNEKLAEFFPHLPRWMGKRHFRDSVSEWDQLVKEVANPPTEPRVLFMSPEQPKHFIQRPAEFERLKNLLLDAATQGARSRSL